MKKEVMAGLIAMLALTACVPTQPQPAAPRYDLTVSQTSHDEVFTDDVGIRLKPIMREHALTTGGLVATYGYWNAHNLSQKGAVKKILVNLPCFEVQVTNASKNVVSFQKVAIRLVDDAGNSYQAVMKQDVVDFIDQELNSMQSRGWSVDRSSAVGAAKNVKLFDRNYEAMPGLTEKRILAFDLGSPADDRNYYRLLKNAKYLRVMIYNVPVQFDGAGNVSKVAKFEYMFDVARR